MRLRSLIPEMAIWSVLGIGVAVRVITSTSFLICFNFSLSETPNRCSSSITQDAETGQIMLVDTSSRKFRDQYGEHSSHRFDELKSSLRSSNVDFIPIATDKPYMNDLIQFFHMRHRRH